MFKIVSMGAACLAPSRLYSLLHQFPRWHCILVPLEPAAATVSKGEEAMAFAQTDVSCHSSQPPRDPRPRSLGIKNWGRREARGSSTWVPYQTQLLALECPQIHTHQQHMPVHALCVNTRYAHSQPSEHTPQTNTELQVTVLTRHLMVVITLPPPKETLPKQVGYWLCLGSQTCGPEQFPEQLTLRVSPSLGVFRGPGPFALFTPQIVLYRRRDLDTDILPWASRSYILRF